MLNHESAVLVVIDVQGKLAQSMTDKETLFKNLGRLISGVATIGCPIIYSEQYPEKLGETSAEIKNLLENSHRVSKLHFSCWGEPTFREKLKSLQKSQIILAGIEAHVCVYQTAADLAANGFETFVVGDAISSRNPDDKSIALNRMRLEGIIVTGTEMTLFELIKVASGDTFKSILQLVR